MLHLVHLPALQAPITDDMLEGAPCVLSFTMSEKRGQTAEANIVIPNPGLSILRLSNTVAVVETPDDDVRVAAGKVLCRARIAAVPSDLKGLDVTLTLTCCPASHPEDLKATANASVQGAAIPPWTVKLVPNPDPGIVAVIFSGAPGSNVSYPLLRQAAIKVDSFFQQDLVRSAYARIAWNTLTVANALLVLSLPASAAAAARAAAAAQKFAQIGVSNDNDPTHSAFVTYGVVMRVLPRPGGGVDVEVNLSDPRLMGSGFATQEGDYTKAGLPFYDPLFGGGTDDLATSAIEGRSAAWHTDPVTHAITLEDLLTGPVLDLGGLGDDSSTDWQDGLSPVKQVKMRVVVEWEQRAWGAVDIAPVIAVSAGGGSGFISSLQDKVVEPDGDQALDFNGWSAWTRAAKWSYRSSITTTNSFPTGRTILVTYRQDTSFKQGVNPDGTIRAPYKVEGQPFQILHTEWASLNVRNIRYNSAWVSYEYSQPRREVVDLVLDCECQDTYRGTNTVTLPTITLGDIVTVPGVAAYEATTIYNRGDKVLIYGEVWECLLDGVIGFYSFVQKRSSGVSGLSVSVQLKVVNWKSLGTLAPLRDVRSPSFIDTDRGRGVVQHALMRMRRVALDRLQMITISRTYPWELARDVTLRQRVRMLLRDGDQATPFVGKVVAIERRVEAQATVRLTLQVPLGTGRNDALADQSGDDYASDWAATDYSPVAQSQYLVPAVDGGAFGAFSVNGDVECVVAADPLELTVDAFRLNDPFYAVKECLIDYQAPQQQAIFQARLTSGQDPRTVTRDCPTKLRIGMRFMPTYSTRIRQYRAHGLLTVSPRGVDLTTGGEP